MESESNLSAEAGDDAWIFDDAIAAGEDYVDKGSVLRDHAVACGEAHICKGAVLSDRARAEDHARVDGGRMENYSRLSGHGMISAIAPAKYPVLSGECTVCGIVAGNVLVTSQAVVLGDEKIAHDGLDWLVVTERGRSIQRSQDRDKLLSSAEYFTHDRPEQRRKRGPKGAER